MKFNPCGMVLDWLPYCYEIPVWPFRDSDVQVGWRWYPAPPGAKTFPGWSSINSRNWWYDKEEEVVVGEVRPHRKSDNYKGTLPFGVDGQHFCGTLEDFEQGQVYDPNAVPTVYTDEGIPLCCLSAINSNVSGEGSPGAVIRVRAVGAVAAEGSPGSMIILYPLFCEVDGEASPGASVTVTPTVEVGGEASPSALVTETLYVAGEVGGEASPSALVTETLYVAGEVGGEASPSALVATYPPSTGEVGGEASPSALVTETLYVAGAVGGEASPSALIGDYPPTVGAVGGEASPSATVTLTPPAPTPGTSCLTAATISLATPYTYTINNGTQNWFKVAVANGTNYPITMTTVSGNLAYLLYEISACPVGTPFATGATANLSTSRTATANDFIYLQFNATFGTRTYTFQVG